MSVTNKNVVRVTESSSERGGRRCYHHIHDKGGPRRNASEEAFVSGRRNSAAGFVPPAGRLDDPKPRLTKEVANRS